MQLIPGFSGALSCVGPLYSSLPPFTAEATILCQYPAGIPLGLTGPFKFILMIILINNNELMKPVTVSYFSHLYKSCSQLLVCISAQKQKVSFLITLSQ